MLRAVFSNSSGILFSRILGFFRDMLTASTLGVNIYSDIFFVAFQLPNLFRRAFGEGAFSQTFLPTFTRVKKKILFTSSVLYKLLAGVLSITLLIHIFDTEVTKAIATGFDSETVEKASTFVKINFWYLLLIFITTFLSALLHYREHFVTTAYGTALLNLSLIGALTLSNGKSSEEIIYYMSYGVVIGGILQLLAHLIAIHFNSMNKVLYGGLLRWRRFSEVKSETDGFFKRFTLAIWGGGTAQISSFLDTVMASFLITGSISYLYFANRVFQFPLAIFAIATTIAIFPRVSKLIKQNKDGEAREIFKKSFWLLAYLLSLSTLVGVLFAEEIVKLLFERGAFGEADRLATAQVLIFYLLGLSIFGVSKLFSLWLYAHERIGTSAKISTYSLIVKIVSALLLIQPLGASGLALSTTISSLTLLLFTLNEFGWNNIKEIIFDKLGLYLIIVLTSVYQIYLFYFLSL
jgi:putative peptidoglycan lipid II flippase